MKEYPLPLYFQVPLLYECGDFLLKPLIKVYAEQDYLAVQSSLNTLKKRFPNWPDEMTFSQNRDSIIKHENDFHRRVGFAFSIFSESSDDYCGCLYVYSIMDSNYDAIAYFWLKDEIANDAIENDLFKLIDEWLTNYWRFSKIAYPGINISWASWQSYLNSGKED